MNWTERVIPFQLHPLGFIEGFIQHGASLTPLLERSGINRGMLDLPNCKISYRQFVALLRSGIHLCKQPGLGLLIGRHFDWCYYGLPGMAIKASTSFRQAAIILHRYTCLAQPYYAAYKCKPAYFVDNHQRVIIPVQYLMTGELEDEKLYQFELEFRIGLILQILHQFTGDRESQAMDVQVQLSFPRPYYAHVYQQVANCHFQFACETSRFVLPAAMLSVGEERMRRAVCDHVLRYCGPELAAMESSMTCANRVMALFYENIPHYLNQTEVADMMGITTRTLARRLQQENTSFTDVLNGVRQEVATYFLSSTGLSIADIAESLGFSDTTNFRQAFKRWTGYSACALRGSAPKRQRVSVPLAPEARRITAQGDAVLDGRECY